MSDVQSYLKNIVLPAPDSHKGQNGKLLIVGGSDLFHAASKWSLDIASKFVDMVFYASIPQNNELIKEAKGQFWNGIVISRDDIEGYIEEADCILIGPGMERTVETKKTTDFWLAKYADKKWVIDAGALQMVDPHLLNLNCIITPHHMELSTILTKLGTTVLYHKPLLNTGATVVVKGQVDHIYQGDVELEIEGGNAGMTKGGTGDVLAGLVAALYCKHNALTAAVVGSYVNKKAGDALYKEVGPFFNASDLVSVIPEVLWDEISKAK